jgi:hypothetical protein
MLKFTVPWANTLAALVTVIAVRISFFIGDIEWLWFKPAGYWTVKL